MGREGRSDFSSRSRSGGGGSRTGGDGKRRSVTRLAAAKGMQQLKGAPLPPNYFTIVAVHRFFYSWVLMIAICDVCENPFPSRLSFLRVISLYCFALLWFLVPDAARLYKRVSRVARCSTRT